MGYRGPLAFITLFIIATGTVLHTVGMATPDWTVYVYSEMGPYTACDAVSCGETSVQTEDSSVEAVRGLTMTAMALGVIACIVVIFMWVKPDISALSIVAAVICFIAFLFILIAVCIWAADVHDEDADIGYSFVLSIVGGVIILLGGVMAFIAGRAH